MFRLKLPTDREEMVRVVTYGSIWFPQQQPSIVHEETCEHDEVCRGVRAYTPEEARQEIDEHYELFRNRLYTPLSGAPLVSVADVSRELAALHCWKIHGAVPRGGWPRHATIEEWLARDMAKGPAMALVGMNMQPKTIATTATIVAYVSAALSALAMFSWGTAGFQGMLLAHVAMVLNWRVLEEILHVYSAHYQVPERSVVDAVRTEAAVTAFLACVCAFHPTAALVLVVFDMVGCTRDSVPPDLARHLHHFMRVFSLRMTSVTLLVWSIMVVAKPASIS